MFNKYINSILINTDSYKVSMWKQYPANTEIVYSYITARSGDEVMLFGLQSYLMNYLSKPITQAEINFADKYWTMHGEPFNREGWEYILREHNGYLPLKVRALPEGGVYPTKVPYVVVENTDPKVWWLTTWVETSMLRAVWYPSTVATNGMQMKRILLDALTISGDPSGVDFKLHDFGARGCSSNETASLGGMAHLVNFKGTDTFVGAIRAMEDYPTENMPGFSIPAAEHSTITSWGRENEQDAYANMVKQFSKPGSIYAVVSDSYNIFEAARMWCTPEMREMVISSGGTLVVRPDSGDPVKVLEELFTIFAESYGVTINDKGYEVLNNVRLIWGDGINEGTMTIIIDMFLDSGWSIDNIAFGMGGALLGAPQRDDYGWAMKCSAVRINGSWQDVYKDPITASDKASLRGRVITLRARDGKYFAAREDWPVDALEEVYLNGTIRNPVSFDVVVERAKQAM